MSNQAKRFLKCIGGEENALSYFQAIHDKDRTETPFEFRGSLDECEPELRQLNDRGFGIFTQINANDGQGSRNENISHFRAAFADIDEGGLPSAGFPLPPTMIIQSSPGKYQVYWCLKSSELVTSASDPIYQGVLRSIIKRVGSDAACKDVRRVLRLPGFIHCKRDPQQVTIISADGPRYSLDDLAKTFTPVPEIKRRPAIPEEFWPPIPQRVQRARSYIEKIRPVRDGEGHNNHLFSMAALLRTDFALPDYFAFLLLAEHDASSPTPAKADDLRRVFVNAGKHSQGGKGSMYSPSGSGFDSLLGNCNV